MPRSNEEQAATYEELLIHLYEGARLMLNGWALDSSQALPPLPEWADLEEAAQVAFALKTAGMGAHLMEAALHIATVLAQENLGGE